MRGFCRQSRRVWEQTLLEIVDAHCLGGLDWRSNLTINPTDQEMYKVGGWLLAGFLPPHGGQSYTHQSCTKVLEVTWGTAESSLGTGTVLLTRSADVPMQGHMGVCPLLLLPQAP